MGQSRRESPAGQEGPELLEIHRWPTDHPGDSFRFQVYLLAKAFGKVNWFPVMTIEGAHIVMSIPCKREKASV